MSILDRLGGLFEDPPPLHVFELSQAGIAWAVRSPRRGQPPRLGFQRVEAGVLTLSPVRDNVADPAAFARAVAEAVPANGGGRRKREAAVILPDYCARVAVLDFESFPGEHDEQLQLVRFRLKKAVPFDLDSATVNFHAHRSGKHWEVVVAAASEEIVAKYEAPFRQAGYLPGFCTTSMLAAMDLMPARDLNVAAKLSDRVLTVALCDGRHPKLVRCVELAEMTFEEVMAVLYPTLAYAEDELRRKPARMVICGFGDATSALREQWATDLQIPVEAMRSHWADPGEFNAGLMGWLQAQEHLQ
jgi:type IV pilus assembly protein PilM